MRILRFILLNLLFFFKHKFEEEEVEENNLSYLFAQDLHFKKGKQIEFFLLSKKKTQSS